MIRLLPMLPFIIEGILLLICGIYQVATGKESFLMSSYRKKYNYEKNKEKFVKACGVIDVTMSVFIAIILPFIYFYDKFHVILFLKEQLAPLLHQQFLLHRELAKLMHLL